MEQEEKTSDTIVSDVQPKKIITPIENLNVDEDISEVNSETPTLDAVILPSSVYKDVSKVMRMLDNIEDENFTDNYDENDKLTVGIVADGLRVSVKNDALVKTLQKTEAEWTNNPKYSDKILSIRELALGSKGSGGNIKGSAAAARFYSHLGLGGLIQIPLWHSGFWITLKAIKESELLNLEMMIANNQITLGRETNTLIFSNYSVVFTRLVTEFLTRHIQSCSLDIDNMNDVVKYIKIQDLYPFVLGLIQSMYLKGFKDVRSCINSLDVDEVTGKPKCNYTMSSTIDPKKLLWLNRKEITDKHMTVMIKRGPKTVTIDECKEYQNTLDVNKSKIYDILTDSGATIILELETPSIRDYIDAGEKWVNNTIELTEKLFTEKLTMDEKNKRVQASSKMVLLGIYNHFIKSVGLPDGSVVTDKESMNEILEIIVSDQLGYKNILKSITEYIDENTIAIVAIPNYRCPSCKSLQKENNDDKTNPFKDLIPMNVLEAFFDLSTLKTSKITERTLD